VIGLAAVGVIYQQGTWSAGQRPQGGGKPPAASPVSPRKISIEMLEARRDEKNFSAAQAGLLCEAPCAVIGRDRPRFSTTSRRWSGPPATPTLSEKIGVIHDGFRGVTATIFAVLALVQAKIGLGETTGLTGVAAQGGRHHRGRGQPDQRSEADQPPADHAPARKGFHAVA